MGDFTVTEGGKVASFSDVDKLLEVVGALLSLGHHPMISVPKQAVAAVKGVGELLKRHGIEVVLTVDSDPQAIDYAIHCMLGGTVGAAVGIAAGAGALALAARYGYLVPGVGWVISLAAIAGLAGLAIGATTGLAVTRMGLRAKFSPINNEVLDLELLPSSV